MTGRTQAEIPGQSLTHATLPVIFAPAARTTARRSGPVRTGGGMSRRADAAASAIARVLRPVVRLALAFGLKYQQLDAIVRDLLLDEAARAVDAKRINVSQLSVTTGLSRADIKERAVIGKAPLPSTELSYAAKTFTLWQQRAAEDPSLRKLPVVSAEGPNFSALARAVTRGNVHHRAVLSELVRLGMAEQQGGEVVLLAAAFVPTNDEQSMLSFLADNTRDHLHAAVSNVLGGQPPFLERVVFSQGIAERDCIAAIGTMRAGWNRVHASLVPQLNQAVDALGGDAPFRIRLGVYAYYEPWDQDEPLDPLEGDEELK